MSAIEQWQFGIVLGEQPQSERPQVIHASQVHAFTDWQTLSHDEAADVIRLYWDALDRFVAAGHQLDEGIYIGSPRSEVVCRAICALVEITPDLGQAFGLALKRRMLPV